MRTAGPIWPGHVPRPLRISRRENCSWTAVRTKPLRRRSMLDERAVLELFDRLLDLPAAVHHNRTPPRNRLVERLARHQEEPRRRVAGLHPDRIAILEDDEVTVLDDVVGFLVETGPTFQQVGEGREAPLHGMHEVRVRLEAHVDVFRVDSNILDRPAIPADLPGHDPHPNAPGGLNLEDARGLDLLVSRIRHPLRLRHVHPELEAPQPVAVHLRHLLVDDPAPRGHPLHVPAADDSLVPDAVLMLDATVQHVGDCLDATVRMPRETRDVFRGVLGTEVVQQKERIQPRDFRGAERSTQVDAGPFDRWSSGENLRDRPDLRLPCRFLAHDGCILRSSVISLTPPTDSRRVRGSPRWTR